MPSVRMDGLPWTIRDFDHALDIWKSREPWKGMSGPWDPRPLATGHAARKKHLAIRRVSEDAVACRLYSTDVVTYHRDGRVEIVPWGSQSTDQFIRHIIPGGIEVVSLKNPTLIGCRTESGEWEYYSSRESPLEFKRTSPDVGQWEFLSKRAPIEKYRVNRKKMREAMADSCAHRYIAWKAAKDAMTGENQDRPQFGTYAWRRAWRDNYYYARLTLWDQLKTRERWGEITVPPRKIRDMVAEKYGCIECVGTIDSAKSYGIIQRADKASRRTPRL